MGCVGSLTKIAQKDDGYEKCPLQNLIDPVYWSLSLEQMLDFFSACTFSLTYDERRLANGGFVNLYDINTYFVKPQTYGTGHGIALKLNKDQPMLAKILISHAWGEDVTELTEALRTRDLALDVPVWFCLLSMYQCSDDFEEVGPSIEDQLAQEPFKKVIQLPGVLMIVVHTSLEEVYQRLWCAYEIDQALSTGVYVMGACSVKYAQKHVRAVGCYGSVENEGLRVATKDARCSHAADENMIRAAVLSKGGWQRLDSVIFSFRLRMMGGFLPVLHLRPLSGREAELSLSLDCRPARYLLLRCAHVSVDVTPDPPFLSNLEPPLFVDAVEVVSCGGRVRARIADPEGWITIRELPTDKSPRARRQFPQDLPGPYHITSHCNVRSSAALDSSKIGECTTGMEITVVQVLSRPADRAICAYISELKGWITLGSFRYADGVTGIDKTVMKEAPGLNDSTVTKGTGSDGTGINSIGSEGSAQANAFRLMVALRSSRGTDRTSQRSELLEQDLVDDMDDDMVPEERREIIDVEKQSTARSVNETKSFKSGSSKSLLQCLYRLKRYAEISGRFIEDQADAQTDAKQDVEALSDVSSTSRKSLSSVEEND